MFAGAVSQRLLKNPNFNYGDAALSVSFLYQQAEANPYKFLRKSSHAERLSAMGLKPDIKYCLSLDKTDIIPVLDGKYLVRLIP